MTEQSDWEIKTAFQPKAQEVDFDLDRALAAVVGLKAEIPDDAFTAQTLGTERAGNGVVIRDDGLVLTIGYLITEAETIWLTSPDGRAVPGHVAAYDQETGFGLVLPLGRLEAPALPIGRAADLRVDEPVVIAGHGGRRRSIAAKITALREFAGYWEYVLDRAIFAAPAHPHWAGTALIARDGTLRGIGSLFVQTPAQNDDTNDGNMLVPIDLLPPILDDLLRHGRQSKPPRPWLGLFVTDSADGLVVAGLAPKGPAMRAGVRPGDRVLTVAGAQPKNLADFFRRVWALGVAGVEVPLTVTRDGGPRSFAVRSAARADFLKGPRLH